MPNLKFMIASNKIQANIRSQRITFSGSPKMLWLAILAFGLQYLVVREVSDPFIAKAVLAVSHLLLILVIIRNWRLLVIWLVGLGLLLNLLPTYSNGGLMPIAPDAITEAGLGNDLYEPSLSSRFGAKNVVLEPDETSFYHLSDRFPIKFPRPMLYSIGDVVLVSGLMLMLYGVLWHGLTYRGDEK